EGVQRDYSRHFRARFAWVSGHLEGKTSTVSTISSSKEWVERAAQQFATRTSPSTTRGEVPHLACGFSILRPFALSRLSIQYGTVSRGPKAVPIRDRIFRS